MNWELVLTVAFSSIGLIEFSKGCLPQMKSWVWRVAFVALCPLLALAYSLLPPWVQIGGTALAVGTLGYQNIIELVKKRLGGSA